MAPNATGHSDALVFRALPECARGLQHFSRFRLPQIGPMGLSQMLRPHALSTTVEPPDAAVDARPDGGCWTSTGELLTTSDCPPSVDPQRATNVWPPEGAYYVRNEDEFVTLLDFNEPEAVLRHRLDPSDTFRSFRTYDYRRCDARGLGRESVALRNADERNIQLPSRFHRRKPPNHRRSLASEDADSPCGASLLNGITSGAGPAYDHGYILGRVEVRLGHLTDAIVRFVP